MQDLISRLKQYADFLEVKRKEGERIMKQESLSGSIASEKLIESYKELKDKFYELVPEAME